MRKILDSRSYKIGTLPDELRRLADAIEETESFVQELEHTETVKVEEDSTERLTLEYTLSPTFHGIEPVVHDSGLPEDERFGGDE